MTDAAATKGGVLPDEVRAAGRYREPDRYIAALLGPRSVRSDLLALAAFSGELLRVHDIVSDPMVGQIRLQWWHDTLQRLARGDKSGHPVADALGRAMRRHGLPAELLEALIEARISDLQPEAFADDEALRAYLMHSEGALIKLTLRILGVEITPHADAAVSGAALSYGLARALVRLPAALRRGRIIVPLSRLEAAGIRAAAGEARSLTPALAGALADLRHEARVALRPARDRANGLGPRARPAFLPLVMVEPYLQAQERRGFDPLADLAQIAPLRRVWRIWRAHRRGRV